MIKVEVTAEFSHTDEHGSFVFDVSVGDVDGQATLCSDEINGGLQPVGDSLDCWISDSLYEVYTALRGVSAKAARDLPGEIAAACKPPRSEAASA